MTFEDEDLKNLQILTDQELEIIDIIREKGTKKIEKDIYIKFSKKFNEEIYQLEEENKSPFISSSNLNKAIDKALKMSTKLNEICDSGDLEQKRKLQQLVFPSGMGYNKQIDEVQTKRVNSIFSSIPLIATDLAQQKSGEPVKINQFSARVTSSGFKPETFRAVI